MRGVVFGHSNVKKMERIIRKPCITQDIHVPSFREDGRKKKT